MQNETELQVRVANIIEDRGAVRILELIPLAGGELPAFNAGAHIDLYARPDLVRQYSLLNDPQERHRYVVAIALEVASRGGSRFFHDEVRQGDILTISAPRCHFGLEEDAPHSVLIAGGIGVTPIWCMAQQLRHLGRSFELHYAVRARSAAPLLDRIEGMEANGLARIATYFSRDPGGTRPDIAAITRDAPPGAHYYCCGPEVLMEAFSAATSGLARDTIHCEHFTAVAPVADAGGFTIELARTGKSIGVKPGQTILDAVRGAGLRTTSSCREGICGSCETVVLSGTPDHRDAILTEVEKARGDIMMICCSGSLTPKLVLDL
jgi:vanillate O-demethylase ferredoxin subunit